MSDNALYSLLCIINIHFDAISLANSACAKKKRDDAMTMVPMRHRYRNIAPFSSHYGSGGDAVLVG